MTGVRQTEDQDGMLDCEIYGSQGDPLDPLNIRGRDHSLSSLEFFPGKQSQWAHVSGIATK